MARAPLADFLSAVTTGNNVLTPEMYAYFGGDNILSELRKYDPEARFTDIDNSGNDSGAYSGKRLDFDWNKLPKSKAGSDFSINPSNLHDTVLNPGAVYDDPVYGKVTNSGNFAPDKKTALETYGPLVMAAITMGAGALGAAPAMAGVAGGTAGVTGGAAGLAAGNIATGGAGSFLTTLLSKSPQLAKQLTQSGGNFNIMSLLPLLAQYAGGAVGIDPNITKTGMTLAQLANQRKRP